MRARELNKSKETLSFPILQYITGFLLSKKKLGQVLNFLCLYRAFGETLLPLGNLEYN